MAEEIVKYDASVVMQGVKDKIKATFVSLVPDNKWDEMIQIEIDNWLKPEQWGDKQSQFSKLVNECMTGMIKDKIKKLLEEKYISSIWENNELKPNEAIEKIITENAGKIMLSVVGGMVQQVVNNMQYQR